MKYLFALVVVLLFVLFVINAANAQEPAFLNQTTVWLNILREEYQLQPIYSERTLGILAKKYLSLMVNHGEASHDLWDDLSFNLIAMKIGLAYPHVGELLQTGPKDSLKALTVIQLFNESDDHRRHIISKNAHAFGLAFTFTDTQYFLVLYIGYQE